MMGASPMALTSDFRTWWIGWVACAIVPTAAVSIVAGGAHYALRLLPIPLLLGLCVAWAATRSGEPDRFPRWLALVMGYLFGVGPWLVIEILSRSPNWRDLAVMHLGPFVSAVQGTSFTWDFCSALAFIGLPLGIVCVAGCSVRSPSGGWVLILTPLLWMWCVLGLVVLHAGV